jgi:hypothetical protein
MEGDISTPSFNIELYTFEILIRRCQSGGRLFTVVSKIVRLAVIELSKGNEQGGATRSRNAYVRCRTKAWERQTTPLWKKTPL